MGGPSTEPTTVTARGLERNAILWFYKGSVLMSAIALEGNSWWRAVTPALTAIPRGESGAYVYSACACGGFLGLCCCDLTRRSHAPQTWRSYVPAHVR